MQAPKTTADKNPRRRAARLNDPFARHIKWLRRAEAIAQAPVSAGGSTHPKIKVGAVLVDAKDREIATASNRFAAGIDRRRPERYKNGSKSLWNNCAEQMALAQALRQHAAIKDADLYVTLEPCAVCAGLIAETGIRRVFVPVGSMRRYARLKIKWKESIEIGIVKLAEAGVALTAIDDGKQK